MTMLDHDPTGASKQPAQLDAALLTNYAEKFFGFGNREARIWFIGIEEAGGWQQRDVQRRLEAWNRKGKAELEDAPRFYPESGNERWHGATASLQSTWAQLIRMLLAARGLPATEAAILNYQCQQLGSRDGETCLAELLPLPSPKIKEWYYPKWSKLRWLESRGSYYGHLLVARASGLARRIDTYKPAVVIFYGTTFLNTWSCICGATWTQAIPQKLLQYTNRNTTFFVTKHPLDPKLGDGRDDYFQEIGDYFHRNHAKRFASVETVGKGETTSLKSRVPALPARLDWPSLVGNFILNFGTLDLHVQDYLESNLTPAEFNKICKRGFQERVECMRKCVEQKRTAPETKLHHEFFKR